MIAAGSPLALVVYRELADAVGELDPDGAERFHDLLITARGARGITKWPIEACHVARENGTVCLTFSAQGHHEVDLISRDLV